MQKTISYKRLWKMLIDKDIKKQQLMQMANISASSVAKLGRNENIQTEILLRICNALKCDLSDIMELVVEEKNTEGQDDRND